MCIVVNILAFKLLQFYQEIEFSFMRLWLSIVHCDNHLDTLGVDLLALLVPVHNRLGTSGGLTDK